MVHRDYVKTFTKNAAPKESVAAANKLAGQRSQAQAAERRARAKPKPKDNAK